MKFLIDAQLPRRLALRIAAEGQAVVHTLDLPRANRTTDQQMSEISAREERDVVTKDGDFVHTFLLSGRPFKLLLVSTGNIDNAELEILVLAQLRAIVEAFTEHRFLELNRTALVIHR